MTTTITLSDDVLEKAKLPPQNLACLSAEAQIEGQAIGTLVIDAHLAALALGHGCE